MVRGLGSRTILLVTATCFLPATEGDRARVFALIRYLSRRGWRLVVIHMHDREQEDADYESMRAWCHAFHLFEPNDDELRARATGQGPVPLDAWCPDRLVELVRRVSRAEEPAAVLAQFVYLSRCLTAVEGVRGALRILDADNVFSQRGAAYRAAGVPHPWFETTAEEERRGLERADLVLAIQERELEALGRLAPRAPLLLVPHVEPPRPYETPRGCGLLFVGARNPEAAEGIARFVTRAWPRIRRRHPEARLRIAGGVSHDCRGLGRAAGVELVGVVPRLDALYREAAIVLNTTSVGTGLKIKTVEALCWGRALVSTPAGVQGLEGHPDVYLAAATPEELGAAVIGLLGDRAALEALGLRAWRFASRYFAEDAVLGRLEAAIASPWNRPGPPPGAARAASP